MIDIIVWAVVVVPIILVLADMRRNNPEKPFFRVTTKEESEEYNARFPDPRVNASLHPPQVHRYNSIWIE